MKHFWELRGARHPGSTCTTDFQCCFSWSQASAAGCVARRAEGDGLCRPCAQAALVGEEKNSNSGKDKSWVCAGVLAQGTVVCGDGVSCGRRLTVRNTTVWWQQRQNKGWYLWGWPDQRGFFSFFSDKTIVCTFLCTCPINTCSPTYAVRECCPLGTNRMGTLKMDTVQEAAAVEEKQYLLACPAQGHQIKEAVTWCTWVSWLAKLYSGQKWCWPDSILRAKFGPVGTEELR